MCALFYIKIAALTELLIFQIIITFNCASNVLKISYTH